MARQNYNSGTPPIEAEQYIQLLATWGVISNADGATWGPRSTATDDKGLLREIHEWLDREDVAEEEKQKLLASGYLEMLQMRC